MSTWGLQPIESYRVFENLNQTQCHVCDGLNSPEAEFCKHCRAPLALALLPENKKKSLQLVAVIGPTGVGKTTYLGMLTDILSRQNEDLQLLARGAFSVSLQQQSMSALSHRRFPGNTPIEPEGWNWVHCDVTRPGRKRPVELVMPDISGEAFAAEVEHAHSYPVVRAFLSKCSAAILLVDSAAIEEGEEEQDFLAMKEVSYLVELDGDRRKGWPARPVAIVFTKTDQSEACRDDPEEYARVHTPGFWRQCKERLGRHRYFATSVAGACAQVGVGHEAVDIPLRIEPKGVVPPFEWLVGYLGK
jgi:hypothetical protein